MRTSRRLLGLITAGALLASGCGNDPSAADDPRAALEAAMARASAWEGSTVTLRLDIAEDDIPVLAAWNDEDQEVARYLSRSTATVSAHPGEDLADTSDDVMTFALDIAGIDAFELRAIRGELYLRADVRSMMAEFAPEEDADAKLAEVAAGAQAFGIDFLEDVFDGSWIHLSGAEQVARMYGGMMGGPSADQLDPTEIASEVSAATQQLLDQVTIAYVGTDGPGDHLRATVTGQQLVDTFEPLIERYLDAVPLPFGAGGSSFLDEARADPGFARFAATTIPLEVWLADGELAQVGFDLVQFARLNPELPWTAEDEAAVAELDRFVVAAGLARFDGTAEVPDGAIEVDVFELMGKAMGGAFQFDAGAAGA